MTVGGFVWRTAVLWLVHFVAWMVGTAVFPVPLPEGVFVDPVTSLVAMLVVCLVQAALLGGLIRASGAQGPSLWAGVFLAFWGPATFMTQIEVAFFAPSVLLPGTTVMVVGMGTVTALLVVPAAVLLFRGQRKRVEPVRIEHPVARVSAAALLYPPIYLVFGYYVALRQPAIQAYYGIDDPGSFMAQLQFIATHDPWLLVFQVGRGLLWVGLVWLLLRQLRGPLWARAVWIGLALATFMNAQHLLPNPLMPRPVSTIHFIETWPSNFLYGALMVWILLGRRSRSKT